MKRLALITTLAVSLSQPVLAQDGDASPEEPGSGRSLVEEGARMFLEGLMREMEPALRDLEGMAGEIQPSLKEFAQEMGPAFADLLAKVDDLSNYEMPEMLPNGDIIIRRKAPLEPEAPDDAEPDIAPGEEIEI